MTGHENMLQLVDLLQRCLDDEELELFWVQCWLIWNQKNTIVHGGIIQDPSRLSQRAKDLLEEFWVAHQHLMVTNMAASVQSWRPPSGDSYKLNFNAAVFEDTGSLGFGVIIRNYRGEVMAALSAKGPVVSDSEEVEALACRRALEFAVDAGFEELVVEGDNAMVIKSISSLRALRSRLGNVYANIHCLAVGSRCLSFGCVKHTAIL